MNQCGSLMLKEVQPVAPAVADKNTEPQTKAKVPNAGVDFEFMVMTSFQI